MSRLFIYRCLIAVGMLSLGACVNDVDLELPIETGVGLSIRGTLSVGDSTMVSVRITSLSDAQNSGFAHPVRDASVVVVDDRGRGLDVPMVEDGWYRTVVMGNYPVQVGRSYQLSVSTTDGRNYISDLEPLHGVPEPERIDVDQYTKKVINDAGNVIEQEFLRFLVTTSLSDPQSGSRSFLKWDFVGTYKFTESAISGGLSSFPKVCYFFDDLNLQNSVVFNGRESAQEVLSNFFLLEEARDYRFREGFYLSVTQRSLSRNAYEYWNQIDKIVELSGNFFEAPPGRVEGNFHNVDDQDEAVYGFFYPTQEKVIRYYVSPVGDKADAFCPLEASPSDSTVSALCLNCLDRLSSTTIKPDFWEE
ncbi:MAG: DUF4249 domain-containing protein [Saprospiraceae bacterium]